MVKRQKEKQYQSAREHRSNQQLRAGTSTAGSTIQRRLPFHCCALSLTPFTNPVCTKNGIVFDNATIMPFVLKHGVNPVTGQKMTTRELITLHMDKNEEGQWQCPVLTKPFSDFVKIVAIVQDPPGNQANVYSYEAYHELNVKPKNYVDLTTGLKFDKSKHVIVLNDPTNDNHNHMRDINNFHHVLNERQLQKLKPKTENVRHSVTSSRILETIAKEQTKKRRADLVTNDKKDTKKLKIFTQDVDGRQLTSGKASTSLTSTVMDITYENTAREATEEELLSALFGTMKKRKKKGYVTLRTNMGDLGLELDCDIAPRTCMNFLTLAQDGEYNQSVFHRLIPNFMIQGGKPPKPEGEKRPTETSIWGDAFVDEFDDRLVHVGPGVLSMANAGANTNKRQFFITFKSCQHLDRKHSVFGKVVQGLDVLKQMERVDTDAKDRPKSEIKIIQAQVLVNPVEEAQEIERVRIQERAEAKQKEMEMKKKSALGMTRPNNSTTKTATTRDDSSTKKSSSVGKYLSAATVCKTANQDDANKANGTSSTKQKSRLAPPPKKTSFGDFSGW